MDSIIEAQKEQGIIDISLENKNNDLIIQVHDNGTGVDAEYIEKIFDPYFTTKRKGSGIGLYMSKLIIEHHMDGQFLLKDSDIGACFCIILRQKRM
jgi:signal transduction histidine kinase